MNVTAQVQEMDAMVSKGDIVNAVKSFFADTAKTSDYSQVKTADKTQMVEKMEGFLAAIEKVNGITHHRTLVDGQASASEFTFNFNMKDGSKIYWHEVIRRIWNDEGQVVAEEYFNAGG
ncbi:MAG: hypothetical protein AAFQ98_22460 [Bacteroidota bacterium]